ncbi:cobalamin-binding protein [Actinoplanes lobatus]|uniref:Cobalamin-binding protein n=1 Tax=Actinoplanes lobatus TaxID=113568 RepID=A0A7W7HQ87_9ACTN|nr:cobalamin-dependent protein [Actinoplanes lobatus]MBB4754708.1 methanogenic corrinoid protein MtbC1 [Actinoplanes lobatus]GGN66989.1 cobalamin-binding protein [Actinoplanes lobatus]GIE42440.1 cobalamin-binding protein [Actinoplanes lobatus]
MTVDFLVTDRYLGLVADSDEAGAIELVGELHDRGVPAERIIVDLIGGTQLRVGELWAANEWSVAREHAATAVSERALATVAAHTTTREPRGRITLACVDGEWHGMPARMLAELLRLDGWRVDFLGASVPGRHLITHLHQTGPDAVALSCTIPTRLPRAHAEITACRAAGVPVIAGGRGCGPGGRYAARLGAHAWAGSGEEAVARLTTDWPPRTVTGFPAVGTDGHLGGDEEYTHLVRGRPELIATAMERLTTAYPAAHEYDAAQTESTVEDIGHIVDFLAAALYVGEQEIFTDFIVWTSGVLASRGVPPAALRTGLRLIHDQLTDFPAAVAMLDAAMVRLP